MQQSRAITSFAILVLLVLTVTIWIAVLREEKHGVLTVSFLDVGQGDAIFITSPTGRQVLIDGGPGTEVLRKLGKTMPWYDRSIDLVIGTHADMDHIGGLIEVLPRYRVQTAVVPTTYGSTDAWRTYLDKLKQESGARVLAAERGETFQLGGGAYLEVLFPDRNIPNIETNTGCIVTRLVYGETAFILPCDAPSSIENYLVLLGGNALKSNVLKAGHHGSKTSSAALFVGMVDPQYAVFSRGCDNTYDHPSPETVATFQTFNIPTLDTCTDGTITFVSDGKSVTRN